MSPLEPKSIDVGMGRVALVDAEDYERLRGSQWRCSNLGDPRPYRTGTNGPEIMARVIMVAPPGLMVDHINGDTLDNRRANLRLCTHAENMKNRRKRCNSTQPYKGIEKWRQRWYARLRCNGVRYCSAGFETPEQAAAEYNRLALQHHGEFARLNKL